MPIVPGSCITKIESELASANFILDKSPHTKKMVEIITKNILEEVKKGTVNVTITGTSASGGPVTGSGTGTIS